MILLLNPSDGWDHESVGGDVEMVTPGSTIRLLVTGGGTGGHLFPAVAAAEKLRSRAPDAKILFIGTKRRLDKKSLTSSGFEVQTIVSYGLKGKNLPALVKGMAVLPVSLIQAMIKIIAFRPDVVLGVGGYVTGPVIAAARLLGKRIVLHEQNSVPGLANRKLGPLADRICISLPQSAQYFPSSRTTLTGNPVREAIMRMVGKEDEYRNTRLTLLILGGSQGAHRLNELMVDAICNHMSTENIAVIHQTGAADCDMVKKSYQAKGINARVEPFFNDMATIYASTDLLVSRAGATTLAELAVLGKPALLVPYPHAADNHQQKNGEYYVAEGGCLQFIENTLTGAKLAAAITRLIEDPEKRRRMSENMKRLGNPQAAEDIVNACLEGMVV